MDRREQNALRYFGGVPALVVCDNCKQAVIANKDWIVPKLNKDYGEWAEHNHTVILPAKVKKPKYKSSVENAVGILEKGIFHDMEEMDYFSLEQFNRDLWKHLEKLNSAPFTKKPHSRRYYWEEERQELMPLPAAPYEYMERRMAKVSSDYHIRFDNAYYSVDRAYLHKEVLVRASATTVKIFSKEGVANLPMAKGNSKGPVAYRSKPPSCQLQRSFRMERDVFYPEGHECWSQYRGGDPAHSYQPEAGGTDLPDVPGCPELHQKIQQTGIGRSL